MHPLHHAALAEGILAADPRHPPQHHRQNSADHVKHDAQGLDLEHRKGQHGQHQGHQRHPAVQIRASRLLFFSTCRQVCTKGTSSNPGSTQKRLWPTHSLSIITPS